MSATAVATKQGNGQATGQLQVSSKQSETASMIEAITQRYQLSEKIGNRFERMFVMASAMGELRRCLSTEALAAAMQLQGTALGFKTDKDREGGYPPEAVKECLIEAVLRGVYPVGNEFNIISGRAYITKEGYTRLVGEIKGLTNLRLIPGVPATTGGGALVPYIATWMLNGKAQRLDCVEGRDSGGNKIDGRIAVRVNANMGVDAIIGKATRKMLKRVYEYITGSRHDDHEDIEELTIREDKPVMDILPPGTPPTRTEQVTQQLQQHAAQQGLPLQVGEVANAEAAAPVASKPAKKLSKQQLVAKVVADLQALAWDEQDAAEFLSRWDASKPEDLTVPQLEDAVVALMGLLADKASEAK